MNPALLLAVLVALLGGVSAWLYARHRGLRYPKVIGAGFVLAGGLLPFLALVPRKGPTPFERPAPVVWFYAAMATIQGLAVAASLLGVYLSGMPACDGMNARSVMHRMVADTPYAATGARFARLENVRTDDGQPGSRSCEGDVVMTDGARMTLRWVISPEAGGGWGFDFERP